MTGGSGASSPVASQPAAENPKPYQPPWSWRIALNHGFFDRDGLPTFHAHDVNDLAACAPYYGLVTSAEPPNEGSNFCPDCLVVTRDLPEARARRVESEVTDA